MSTEEDQPEQGAVQDRLAYIEKLLNAVILHLGVDIDAIERAPGRMGQTLPKAMGAEDMRRAFGISYRTFRRHELSGEFRPFELPRRIGTKRYSGDKVQSFLRGRQ